VVRSHVAKHRAVVRVFQDGATASEQRLSGRMMGGCLRLNRAKERM
jgi:hypothetical protein